MAELKLHSTAVRDDREFLDRLAQGEGDCLTAALAHFSPGVEQVVTRRFPHNLRHRLCPVDVVQIACFEFVLRVREAAYRFNALADVQATLVTIALDKLRQQVRDHRRACRNVGREAALREYAAAESLDEVAAPYGDPFAAVAASDQWEAFLDQLPLLHQTIVQLRAERYTIAEIAVLVEHSPRFVNQVLASVRRRLSLSDD